MFTLLLSRPVDHDDEEEGDDEGEEAGAGQRRQSCCLQTSVLKYINRKLQIVSGRNRNDVMIKFMLGVAQST